MSCTNTHRPQVRWRSRKLAPTARTRISFPPNSGRRCCGTTPSVPLALSGRLNPRAWRRCWMWLGSTKAFRRSLWRTRRWTSFGATVSCSPTSCMARRCTRQCLCAWHRDNICFVKNIYLRKSLYIRLSFFTQCSAILEWYILFPGFCLLSSPAFVQCQFPLSWYWSRRFMRLHNSYSRPLFIYSST